MIGDEEPEPRRVQVRTRPDDAVRGEPGELPRHVGQHIHGVRNDEQHGVRRVPCQRRDNALEQSEVPLQQVQPGLAGDLACAGGDDADVGAGGDGVVDGGVDLGAGEEGGGVLEVKHLAAELVGLGVHQDELVGQVLSEDGLRDGHPDVSGADHGDLVVALRRGGWGGVGYGPEEGLS